MYPAPNVAKSTPSFFLVYSRLPNVVPIPDLTSIKCFVANSVKETFLHEITSQSKVLNWKGNPTTNTAKVFKNLLTYTNFIWYFSRKYLSTVTSSTCPVSRVIEKVKAEAGSRVTLNTRYFLFVLPQQKISTLRSKKYYPMLFASN